MVTLSIEMARGDALQVPVCWLWAEKAAGDLIAASDVAVSPATFEFRTTRDVLALTLFLADLDRSSGEVPADCLELIRDHLAVTLNWLRWCQSGLDAAAHVVASATDMRLARDTWRWLRRGRLLAGPALTDATCEHHASPMVATAICVGLSRARHILNRTPP